MLAAGMDGVKRGLQPPDPVEENVYDFDDKQLTAMGIATLPGSLAEALDELEKDTVLQEALGSHHLQALRGDQEGRVAGVPQSGHQWEMDRYLEVL